MLGQDHVVAVDHLGLAGEAEQTLELASRRFRGGIGLQELLLEAAWANGYTGAGVTVAKIVKD